MKISYRVSHISLPYSLIKFIVADRARNMRHPVGFQFPPTWSDLVVWDSFPGTFCPATYQPWKPVHPGICRVFLPHYCRHLVLNQPQRTFCFRGLWRQSLPEEEFFLFNLHSWPLLYSLPHALPHSHLWRSHPTDAWFHVAMYSGLWFKRPDSNCSKLPLQPCK